MGFSTNKVNVCSSIFKMPTPDPPPGRCKVAIFYVLLTLFALTGLFGIAWLSATLEIGSNSEKTFLYDMFGAGEEGTLKKSLLDFEYHDETGREIRYHEKTGLFRGWVDTTKEPDANGDYPIVDPPTGDKSSTNKILPYVFGYGGALCALKLSMFGGKEVFGKRARWVVYIGVFLIIGAALIAGSRMYDSTSGLLGGGDNPVTWLPFAVAAVGTTLILGSFIKAMIPKNATNARHGSHGPIVQSQTGGWFQGGNTPGSRQSRRNSGRSRRNHHLPNSWSCDGNGNRINRRLLQEKFDPSGLPTTLGVLLLIC